MHHKVIQLFLKYGRFILASFVRPRNLWRKLSGDFAYIEKVEAQENYFNGELID